MRLLTENLWWKLLALAIATLLWYGFVSETEVATSLPVAIQFENIPADLEFASEQIDRVYVRLRGPASRLRHSELASVSMVIDLGQVREPGERTFNLGADTIRLPPGVTLTRVIPSQIRLALDRRANRDVPVEVRFAGPPPHGYRVASQKVLPEQIRIIGPESRVHTVQAVQTDAINLSSTVSNTEFRIPVYVPDAHVRIEEGSTAVTVRIIMEKIPQ